MMNEPNEESIEPEENARNWRTAIYYGLFSFALLFLAMYAFFQQQAAEAQRVRAQRVFIEELQTLLTKRKALEEAQEQVAILGREIQSLPHIANQDKARL